MAERETLGGQFTLPGTTTKVHRLGYGAMQLAGPHVWGPPRDRNAAVAVLREAVKLGIDHIDTSDFYGPHVTNQIIREALHPYPRELTIVTKVGFRRDGKGDWLPSASPDELTSAVEDNLRNLGLDALEVVNLRLGNRQGPTTDSLEAPLTALAELQQRGLIRHLGLSTASPEQYDEGRKIAKIVCIQNEYNLAQRRDEAFVDRLERDGVAYVPYFPLGGFTPLQAGELETAAKALHATPMQVALAWLLQRAKNILLIPGTSSVAHLQENVRAAELQLPGETLAELEGIAARGR